MKYPRPARRGSFRGRRAHAARLVESRSTHPIARAIMKTAPGSHGFALEAVESKEIPGKGLSAEHKGRTLLVGNALLLQDAGISVPSLQPVRAASFMSPSAMPISEPLKYRTYCGPNPLPPSNHCAVKVLKGWSC